MSWGLHDYRLLTVSAYPGMMAPLTSHPSGAAYGYTARIATWLRRMGHRGLFGADVAVSGNNLAFLEVNPRIQGSSWLLDKLMRRAGLEGCLTHHVEAILGRPAPPRAHREFAHEWGGQPPVIESGSHMIVRWSGPSEVVRQVLAAGSRPDLPGLAVTGLPRVGTVVMTGAIIARFESDANLAAPGGTALTDQSRAVVRDLVTALEVTPA